MHSRPENKKINDYLGRMCSPLLYSPAELEEEARRETLQHLDALIAEFESQGLTPPEAVDAALQQFGDPEKIGREIRLSWIRKIRSLKIRKWINMTIGTVWGACFGLSLSAVGQLHLSLSSVIGAVLFGLLVGFVNDLYNTAESRIKNGQSLATWCSRHHLGSVVSKISANGGESLYYIKRLIDGLLMALLLLGGIWVLPLEYHYKIVHTESIVPLFVFAATVPIGEMIASKTARLMRVVD